MSFTYIASAADWARIAPVVVVLAVVALLVLMADLLLPQPAKHQQNSTTYLVLPILSLLGLAGAIIATIILFIFGDLPAFYMMIGSDQGSLYAYMIILSASALGILLSPDYLNA